MSVLLLYAHPGRPRAVANTALLAAARRIDGIHVHDLYEHYPDFSIDVAAEQALLLAHRTIVLQHPLYWYSVPALAKLWIDEVLEFGWAYGPGGDRLAGRRWAHAITTGGAAGSYVRGGQRLFPLDELLRPLQSTARLCGLHWAEPFVVHGAGRLDDAGLADAGRAYADWLRALAGGR